MADFFMDFIGGIIELLLEPWINKITAKFKHRKKKYLPLSGSYPSR